MTDTSVVKKPQKLKRCTRLSEIKDVTSGSTEQFALFGQYEPFALFGQYEPFTLFAVRTVHTIWLVRTVRDVGDGNGHFDHQQLQDYL